MTFALVRWTAALIVSLTITLFGVRLLGGIQPSAAADVLRLGECPQPCWHHIVPGTTSLDQAEALLRAGNGPITNITRLTHFSNYAYTYRELCWLVHADWAGCASRGARSPLDGPVTMIELEPPLGSFRLGDAMLVFGEPEAATLCRQRGGRIRYFVAAEVYFGNHIEIRAYQSFDPDSLRFDPHMLVSAIRYHYPAEDPPYRFDTPPWRGFVEAQSQGGC